MEKFKESDFIELFKEIKTVQKGRKATTRGLSSVSKSNFKKLIKRGYEREDFEKAINQMFINGYAIENGLDVPDHILIEKNFDRYLNAFENAENLKKIKEAEKKEALENKQDPKIIDTKQPYTGLTTSEIMELTEKAKQIYTESLVSGIWLGGLMDAVYIGRLFTNDFTADEKKEFLRLGEIASEKEKESRSNSLEGIKAMVDRIGRKTPRYAMFEIVVKEAVKRKIKEPW